MLMLGGRVKRRLHSFICVFLLWNTSDVQDPPTAPITARLEGVHVEHAVNYLEQLGNLLYELFRIGYFALRVSDNMLFLLLLYQHFQAL